MVKTLLLNGLKKKKYILNLIWRLLDAVKSVSAWIYFYKYSGKTENRFFQNSVFCIISIVNLRFLIGFVIMSRYKIVIRSMVIHNTRSNRAGNKRAKKKKKQETSNT